VRRALAAFAFVLVACGSSDSGSASGGTSGGTTPPPGTTSPGTPPGTTPPPGSTPPSTPPGACGALGAACCTVGLPSCTDGATCTASMCVAGTGTKTKLASSARSLLLRDGFAYYLEKGMGLWRQGLDPDAGARQLVPNSTGTFAVGGVDAGSAYVWSGPNPATLTRTSVLGIGPIGLVVPSLDTTSFYSNHVDSTHVSFSYVTGSTFYFTRVARTGGSLDTITSAGDGSARIDAIEDDASFLYTRSYAGEIAKWDRTTKAKTAYTATATFGQGFTSTGTDLYWAETVGDPTTGTGRVMRVAKSGGTPALVATIAARPSDLTNDGTNLYVAIDFKGKTDSGAILSIPLAGGTAKLLVDGLYSPKYLAVANGRIYYLNQSITFDGDIVSTPLP
jgi:hypothetical protein